MDVEGRRKPFCSKSTYVRVESIPFLGAKHSGSCMTTPVQNNGFLVRTWGGESKAVSTIRFSPDGNFILCGGIGNEIQIWNVDSDKCVKVYSGHTKSVTDMCFNIDASKFLSSSFDKGVVCWDMGTGMPISTLEPEHVPLVVKFIPEIDNQNSMVAGLSDGTVLRWDIRLKEHNCVYDGRGCGVNSITFVNKNKGMVSTSADKTMILWSIDSWKISNFTIKRKEILSMSLHPRSDFLAGQTLNGQILVYGQDLEEIEHKIFLGQGVNDGYCDVSVSPDGFNLMSGDAQGQCWFWDWDSCQVRKTVKCHRGSCLGAAWHPLDHTKYATSGRDGLIKLWSLKDLSVAAQKTDCSCGSITGVDSSCSFPWKRDSDNENPKQENDNVSAALLMIAIATLLATITMNAETYIPENKTIKMYGLSARIVDVFCTAANIGQTALWWGLIVLAFKIRPFRVVSLLGLASTWAIYWFALYGFMSLKWFIGNVCTSNFCLLVSLVARLVRTCSRATPEAS